MGFLWVTCQSENATEHPSPKQGALCSNKTEYFKRPAALWFCGSPAMRSHETTAFAFLLIFIKRERKTLYRSSSGKHWSSVLLSSWTMSMSISDVHHHTLYKERTLSEEKPFLLVWSMNVNLEAAKLFKKKKPSFVSPVNNIVLILKYHQHSPLWSLIVSAHLSKWHIAITSEDPPVISSQRSELLEFAYFSQILSG